MEVVLLQHLCESLHVRKSQLRLDEGVLGHHDFVLMLITLRIVLLGHLILNPVLWLLGQSVVKRDLHLASIDDLSEEVPTAGLLIGRVA